MGAPFLSCAETENGSRFSRHYKTNWSATKNVAYGIMAVAAAAVTLMGGIASCIV